ncbi:suppressor of fused domain protein [Collimonas sp. OK412]|jgi:hypothetical protein|uniref:suppressor of fused domain protein n=1 Tax=Collimonas sp. (strain OK412) TaxID=1801619 RepID=UPI0008E3C3A7|nr:suppressor of fused domain protein [Collimonas sp. OK412]SFD21207.1 Suppressor of fused protein (SUFU) [Collimonas sp. OK412]
MGIFSRLFGKQADLSERTTAEEKISADVKSVDESASILWQQVYDARVKIFEENFGELPQDILKLGDLFGVWPGGGLFAIPANKFGDGAMVYTTFGLSNPDMPTDITVTDLKTESDGKRIVRTQSTLNKKDNIRPASDRPGYGYEIMVVTKEKAEWPLWLLQWAVKAELLRDADLLGRVEKYQGLTIEKIQVGDRSSVNILISKAKAPLAATADLPNGALELLVATVITDDEMQWSMQNGRDALLNALSAAEIGQFSILNRNSVVTSTEITSPNAKQTSAIDPALDFSDINSRDAMMNLAAEGKLVKILLFPAEFGGQDVLPNTVYVPAGAVEIKHQVTSSLAKSLKDGLINNLNVQPEYKGTSFVPSRIHVKASHSENGNVFEQTIEIW